MWCRGPWARASSHPPPLSPAPGAVASTEVKMKLQEFVLNKLGDISNIGAIESTFVMSEIKQNYGINL